MITLTLKERGPQETKMDNGKVIGEHMEYTATIHRHGKQFSLRYGGSVHDYQHGNVNVPTLCDVLYCIGMDANGAEDEFGEWCMSTGYDPDSIKGLKIYRAVKRQTANALRLFTVEELQRLSEMEGNESDERVNEIMEGIGRPVEVAS